MLISEYPGDAENQITLMAQLYLYEEAARCVTDNQTTLDDTDYDRKVLCLSELTQREDGVAVTDRIFLEEISEDELPAIENPPASSVALVASQQVLLRVEAEDQNAYEALTAAGRHPYRLHIAPIQALPGTTVVYYIIEFDDGGTADWYEAYPG